MTSFSFRAMSFLGLGLIAFGTGGIKPCVVSFGAEQFKLPDQAARMGSYFGLFYAILEISRGKISSKISVISKN